MHGKLKAAQTVIRPAQQQGDHHPRSSDPESLQKETPPMSPVPVAAGNTVSYNAVQAIPLLLFKNCAPGFWGRTHSSKNDKKYKQLGVGAGERTTTTYYCSVAKTKSD